MKRPVSVEEVKFTGWPHILKSQQFSPAWIEHVLFPLTDLMEKMSRAEKRRLLRFKEIISLFVQESTRTRASFAIASNRLGAQVTFDTEAARTFSSLAKQELLQHMIAVFGEYDADAIVLRYDQEGGAEEAASVSEIPIINAGDGKGQHPTQALLDLRTIFKYLPSVAGIEVAMIGDVEGSRTIHSLAYLLSRYPGVVMHFVAPKHMRIKREIRDHLDEHGVVYTEVTDVREVAFKADVFYQTRTQTNQGTIAWDRRDSENGLTVITEEVMRMAKPTSILMHPLPCNDEIDRAVEADPRAVYLKTRGERMSQVKCGLFTREAELLAVIAPELCVRLLANAA